MNVHVSRKIFLLIFYTQSIASCWSICICIFGFCRTAHLYTVSLSFRSIRGLLVFEGRLSHPCNGIKSLNKQIPWDMRIFSHLLLISQMGAFQCMKIQGTKIGLQLVNESKFCWHWSTWKHFRKTSRFHR